MGYRSDVMAVFYATDVGKIDDSEAKAKEFNERNRAKLKLFVEENFPAYWRGADNSDFDNCLTMLDTAKKGRPGRLVFEFKVDSVKWYEGYPAVQLFNDFWEKFEELVAGSGEGGEEGDDPCDWAAEFVRLGENTEDIEEKAIGDSDWVLQVKRTIDPYY